MTPEAVTPDRCIFVRIKHVGEPRRQQFGPVYDDSGIVTASRQRIDKCKAAAVGWRGKVNPVDVFRDGQAMQIIAKALRLRQR